MKGIQRKVSGRWSLLLCLLLGAVLLAACSLPPMKTTRLGFNYPHIQRLTVHADAGATIEGSWSSDVEVFAWYTAPDGTAYSLGQYQGGPLTLIEPWKDDPSVPYPVHRDGESYAPLAATRGGDIRITTTPPWGGTGDYTLSFLPSFRPSMAKPGADIVVNYRVR